MKINKKGFVLFSSLILVLMFILSSIPTFASGANTWTTKASMSTARGDHQVAVVDGKIYAIGGSSGSSYLNSVEEYDPATNKWITKAPMPTARDFFQVAVVGGKIYAIGGNGNGYNILNSVEEYNPATNTWTKKASMSTERWQHQVAVVGDKIYAIGGFNNTSDYLSTVEEYNPATNTWTRKASMANARGSHEVVVLDGKIYAIGGYNYDNKSLNSVEEYDPATNKWITKAPMTTARYVHKLAVMNKKIYAIGGYNSSGYLNSVEEYDPATDKWITKAAMPTARYHHEVIPVGEKIYAIGGYNGATLNSVEEYNPATNTWTQKASMSSGRWQHQVAVVGDKIYAIGGYNGTSLISSVEECNTGYNVPELPINLTAAAGNAKVDLSWPAAEGATSYNIKRSTTTGGPYTTIKNNVSGTTYTDANVTNETTYYYVVSAVNQAGESGNSNEVSAKPISPAVTTPAATVGNATTTTVDVTVTDSNPETTQYQIISGTQYVTAAGTLTTTPTWITLMGKKVTVTGLTPNTTYSFQVKARDSANIETAWSQPVIVTTLPEALGTIKINFQPVDSEIPQGYIPDYGEIYGVRNGYNYGWNVGYAGATRDRNINADQKLDTLIMLYKTGKWEMAVDNGLYDITVCVGDAGFGSTPTVNVEGVNYWSGVNLGANQYLQETKTVMVTDGRLTIDNGGTADQITKLNYVEISKHSIQLQKPINLQASAAQDTVTLTWEKSYEMDLYEVEADGSIYAVTGVAFTHTFLEGGTTHSYRVRTVNGAEKSEWSDMLTISTQPEAPGTIKINFQPAGSEIPQGYIPDYGEVYGVRNGYNYGWNVGYAGATRDRNINADQKLDTLIMLYKTGKWEMEVEDGYYDVTVCVGDAGFSSTPTVNVEGVNYWAGINLGVNQYLQATKTVMVTDGRLTIDNGGTADQITKIDYVKIVKGNVTSQTPTTVAEDSVAIPWDVVDNTVDNK